MKKSLPFIISAALLLGAGYFATWLLGPVLAPPPEEVLKTLGALLRGGELSRELGLTVLRSLAGLALAALAGSGLGFAAGLSPALMRLVTPLTAAVQTCPPVVWISLLMVWVGTGSTVPVAVVFATTAPVIFSNTAHGVMAADTRLRAMSALYSVPLPRRVRRLFIPSVRPYWLSGFSISLATAWKTAAVAEFFGSHRGVGAKIYWSYRNLAMPELFAWALALVILGVTLECGLITPLRDMANARAPKPAYTEKTDA